MHSRSARGMVSRRSPPVACTAGPNRLERVGRFAVSGRTTPADASNCDRRTTGLEAAPRISRRRPACRKSDPRRGLRTLGTTRVRAGCFRDVRHGLGPRGYAAANADRLRRPPAATRGGRALVARRRGCGGLSRGGADRGFGGPPGMVRRRWRRAAPGLPGGAGSAGACDARGPRPTDRSRVARALAKPAAHEGSKAPSGPGCQRHPSGAGPAGVKAVRAPGHPPAVYLTGSVTSSFLPRRSTVSRTPSASGRSK